MAIDFEQMLKDMLTAGGAVVVKNGLEISAYAEKELNQVVQAIVDIAQNVAENQKDPTQGYPAASGKALMQIQILSLENVLMGIEEMTKETAQQTINAMLDVVKNVAGGVLKALI